MRTHPSPAAARLSTASLLAGGVGAVLLIAVGAGGAARAYLPSYLFIWLFVLGLSLGSMALIFVHDLTGGGWGQAARPVFEAALRVLPATTLLAVPLLFGLPDLLPWMHGPHAPAEDLSGKGWYLNPAFFSARAIAYLAIWLSLAWLLRSTRSARARGTDDRQVSRQRTLASAGFVIYATTTTFAAIDWIMSLTPAWHSTVFGLLIGVGQVSAALCCAIIGAAALARGADEALRGQFHDLGKLLLALVLLWAYLAFMQYLIIWIEDLPDEIGWYLVRTQTSWRGLALVIAAAHFAIPFLALLSSNGKRSPPVLAAVAGMVLFACLADMFWLIVPSFRPEGFAIRWSDALALLAVGGIWLGLLIRAIPALAADTTRGNRDERFNDHAGQHA